MSQEIVSYTRKNVMELKPGDVIVVSYHRGRPVMRTVTARYPETISAFNSLEHPGKTLKVIREHSHLESCVDRGNVHLSTSKGIWCLSREEYFVCPEYDESE